MAFLAAAAPYVGLIGAGYGAYSQYTAGKADAANQRALAIQQEREGKASQAEAQRAAIEERRKAKYAQSRALAVSAASGAGASESPTVANILGDIEAEGEYRALSALYSGDTDAALSRYAAGASRREGRARRLSSYYDASSTILGGVGDFYEKYG